MTQAQADEKDHLLTTHWYQDGPFAQFTPKNDRVGCWSTAMAQIMYYHRQIPFGHVHYKCSDGTVIDENLSKHTFNWNRFVDSIGKDTSEHSKEELARYSYATACVVQKDFGTGSYKRLLNATKDVQDHFSVDADIYVSFGKNLPLSETDLASKLQSEKIDKVIDRQQTIDLVTKEIDARRPVYFHFSNITDFGHSTIIDGYKKAGDQFLVHLNYGAYEPEANKWYDLFAPITQSDDVRLRAYITIKPKAVEQDKVLKATENK